MCLRAPPTSAFCAYVGWQISEFETSDEEALLKIRLVRPPPGTGGAGSPSSPQSPGGEKGLDPVDLTHQPNSGDAGFFGTMEDD